MIVEYFENLYSEEGKGNQLENEASRFPQIEGSRMKTLTRKVSDCEAKKALFEMQANKAMRPMILMQNSIRSAGVS